MVASAGTLDKTYISALGDSQFSGRLATVLHPVPTLTTKIGSFTPTGCGTLAGTKFFSLHLNSSRSSPGTTSANRTTPAHFIQITKLSMLGGQPELRNGPLVSPTTLGGMLPFLISKHSSLEPHLPSSLTKNSSTTTARTPRIPIALSRLVTNTMMTWFL